MRIISYLAMFLILFSCKKDNSKISISGVTETDWNGDIVSENIDADDWILDEVWGDEIHALFVEENFAFKGLPYDSTYKDGIAGNYNTFIGPAYPNPYNDRFSVSGFYKGNYELLVIVVDENLNIVLANKNQNKDSFDLVLSPRDISVGRLYRIYYKVISDSETLYGHGDFYKSDKEIEHNR